MVASEPRQTTVEQDRDFKGPLFIIGMPRSGTKLFRELLNGHSQISIPPVETDFLPYWVKKWSSFGDLSDPVQFSEFYRSVINYPYFIYRKNQVGSIISEQSWYQWCKNYTPAGVFEALMRHDAGLDYNSEGIWGDKSPAYITHMPLLKELFPQAKFIHIIRDVRDYCLSLHKGWGRNMLRAAQRWADSITQPQKDAQGFATDYLEIKYEELLNNPEPTLTKCCEFLGVPFEPTMVNLVKSPENIGDTKGQTSVNPANQGKYMQLMAPGLRQQIEAIAAPALSHFGYPVSPPQKQRRLSHLTMFYLQIIDGLNFIKSESSREGFFNTIKIAWGALTTSGFRH